MQARGSQAESPCIADDAGSRPVAAVEVAALDADCVVDEPAAADDELLAGALTDKPVPVSMVTSAPDVTMLAFWDRITGPVNCRATASASASVLGLA